MMSLKKYFLIAILFLSGTLSASPVLRTGSKVMSLPSPKYLDEVDRTFNEFLNGKFVVLFIWEMNPAALNEFSQAVNIASRYKDDANFVGIGVGAFQRLQRFPGAIRLGFPVNADKGDAKKLFVRRGDKLPLAVIIDKNGTLLWRGSMRQVPGILKECKAGKFDLKEQIRIEEFAQAVNAAVENKELDKALTMIQLEWQQHPAKIELISAQLFLLRKLDRLKKEGLPLIHAAQKKIPANHKIFEMEYRLIGELDQADLLPEFFSRLKKVFANNPEILIAFAAAEFQLPPDKLNLRYIADLAAAGWQSRKFKDNTHRGMYALEYAKILHSLGRNDLALQLAQHAYKDLAGNAKQQESAKNAALYYAKLHQIAPTLKLPDMKKMSEEKKPAGK